MLSKGTDTSHVGEAFPDCLWFEDEESNTANCWTFFRKAQLSSSVHGSEKSQVFSGDTQQLVECGTEEGCLSIWSCPQATKYFKNNRLCLIFLVSICRYKYMYVEMILWVWLWVADEKHSNARILILLLHQDSEKSNEACSRKYLGCLFCFINIHEHPLSFLCPFLLLTGSH